MSKSKISALVLSVATLASFGFHNKVEAQSATKTYRIGHDYGGVHRCGSAQENLKEARIAANNKIKEVANGTGFSVSLKDFKIVDHQTRRWEDKDKFGFSKGRKCQTHLEIDVVSEIRF